MNDAGNHLDLLINLEWLYRKVGLRHELGCQMPTTGVFNVSKPETRTKFIASPL